MPDEMSDELKHVMEWTELTQAMLGSAPEFARDCLKGVVDELAGRCNDRWPLEPGGMLAIGVDEIKADFGEKVGLWSDDVRVAFIGKTSLCLFAGMDGPNLTAVVLNEGIDKLADDIEERERG
jgi:hypothetical protein